MPSIGFAPVSLWEFNEPAGTAFIDTVDSVGGRVFNRGIPGVVTNGDGRLSFAANSGWPDVSTPMLENPEGIYRLTVEFAGWDVSTFPLTQGPRLFFGFYETDDLEVGVIGDVELQFFGDRVDLYFSDSDQEFLFENFDPVVLTSPLTVVMTVNTVLNTFSLSYRFELEGEVMEDSIAGDLAIVSAERVIGTFGVTSNRNFAPAGSIPPQIERIEVAFGGALPEVPAGLRAAEVTTDSVLLEWDAVADVIAYQVWIREGAGNGSSEWTYLAEVTESFLLVEDLLPDTAYSFQVSALNVFGASELSEALSVTTEPEPEPISTLWSTATEVGEGWYHTDWFGFFFPMTGGAGWTYHAEHGWLYIWGESVESLFLFDWELGFAAWTSESVYPFILWSSGSAEWSYYLIGGEPGSRAFFDFTRMEWVEEANLFGQSEI
ncbi:MAG: fibronectin type III domain-containing protein [Opitutales bacterium]|nr:fibronectin type III domain-containing protein [Opitutales bacterium]